MTALSAPPRSIAQRHEALARANQTRMDRARLKADLAAGRRSAADVLASPPEWALTMTVYDVLLAQWRWGTAKTGKLLARHRVSLRRTVGGLTDRQRAEIIAALGGVQ